MRIKFDEEAYVVSFAVVGDVDNSVEFLGEIPKDFNKNCIYYKLINGKLVFDEEKKKLDKAKKEAVERIDELKESLSNTDYAVTKYLEGVINEEEYEEIKNKRIGWREEINSLEEEYGL